MTKAQFITTPDGGELAVLPRDEFERLIEAAEDTADAHTYTEGRRRIDAGEMEMMPAEFVSRIVLHREHPVRGWREFRTLKVKTLAETAGFSPTYLSMIENGTRDGRFNVMKAIAGALRVDLEEIV